MAARVPPVAAAVMARLPRVYAAAADPERAAPMAAYMRHQFPFLGIGAAVQARLTREVLAGLPDPTEADLAAVALWCWAQPEREYQYFATGWLRRHARLCSAGFITTAHRLVVTKSWWDTVDPLAAHLVGPLVQREPGLVSTMDRWIEDENIWLARTAILHQLRARAATDPDRLFRYCRRRGADREFFIRKAIGWALREYARTDPDAVRAFVEDNRTRLAPLSVREATRHL